jgi:hypothetical protein
MDASLFPQLKATGERRNAAREERHDILANAG